MFKARWLNVLIAAGAVSSTMMLTELAFADPCTDGCDKARDWCMKSAHSGSERGECVQIRKECVTKCQKPVTTCIEAGSEYGTYCSGTWPTGGWAFTSDTAGGDVCASIVKTGGTIQRKGLYKNNDTNRVVVRCYPPDYGWFGVYEGVGNGPLTAAHDSALKPSKPGCVFTVSPKSMPIFDAPFPLSAKKQDGPYGHTNGFDFARTYTLNVADFGQPASSAAATSVDWMGRERSYGSGHDAHDWTMDRKTAIKAAARGKVVMARKYDCAHSTIACRCGAPVGDPTCPAGKGGITGYDSPGQLEVAIEHTVLRSGVCGSSGYYEKFLTYYAHLTSYSVSVGQIVNKGQQIGLSGNTGSSTEPHLHFGVIRLTNTAAKLEDKVHWFAPPYSPTTPIHNDGRDKVIEPYGWDAPKGFDPWAWKGYPQGALSPNLWNSNQAPSTRGW